MMKASNGNLSTSLRTLGFLGVAERAGLVREGNTPFAKWNIIGLKSTVLVHFTPGKIDTYHLVFFIRSSGSESEFIIIIRNNSIVKLEMKIDLTPADDPGTLNEYDSYGLLSVSDQYVTIAVPIRNIDLLLDAPGIYSIFWRQSDHFEEQIGSFEILVIEPAPLTPERVAAIKSTPDAAKSARVKIGCKHCPAELKIYTALERTPTLETDDWQWYQNIGDTFVCTCGATTIGLTSIRRNLFSLLGRSATDSSENIDLAPMYEKQALNNLLRNFAELVENNPLEETLQKYIENNLIILHQFSSEKIFFKPAILTFFKADFALVTSKKELILVELERSGTRLLNKDGGEASPFRHAIDQVHSWLHVVDEHRLATLSSLNIARDEISSVRGIVIAGRDQNYDAEHLRRFKGVDRGRVTFLTYDDLLSSVATLVKNMRNL